MREKKINGFGLQWQQLVNILHASRPVGVSIKLLNAPLFIMFRPLAFVAFLKSVWSCLTTSPEVYNVQCVDS